MKSILTCTCAVALLLAGIVAYRVTRPPVTLAVLPPPVQVAATSPAPDLVSSLNVRLSIPQEAIREAIDTYVPRSFSGREDDPISAASDDSLSWSLGVGPAVLGSSDGALAFRVPITDGRVRLVGRLGGGRKSGGALGWLKRIAGVDIDETVTFDGAIVGRLRPRLGADWTLEPDLQADVTLSTAQVAFFGGLLKISLRDAIRDRIDAEVRKQAGRLRERLAEDGRIVSAVQKVWDSMHAVVPLSQEPPVWLSWQPVSLAASVPVADELTVSLTLGTTVRLAVEVAAAPPSVIKRALPAPTTPAEDGAIDLHIPITLPLDAFDGLSPAALGVPERIEHERGTITLGALAIQGVGERLTVAADVTVAHDWAPDMKARLYVSGRPVLDRQANRLSLADASYDIDTRNALLGAADYLLAPEILAWVEKRSVFEILESEQELLARARAELELIQASLPDWIDTELLIDSGRLESVRVEDGWLVAILEVTGRAYIEVRKLAGLFDPSS